MRGILAELEVDLQEALLNAAEPRSAESEELEHVTASDRYAIHVGRERELNAALRSSNGNGRRGCGGRALPGGARFDLSPSPPAG